MQRADTCCDFHPSPAKFIRDATVDSCTNSYVDSLQDQDLKSSLSRSTVPDSEDSKRDARNNVACDE